MTDPTIGHPGRHVAFTVEGVPQPAGSKRAFQHRTTGRVVVTDDAKGSRQWKTHVAAIARQHMIGEPLAGPVELIVTFTFPRPARHFRTGRNAGVMKPDAPQHHLIRPDVTKLLRAVEDALTGIVWGDDAQVISQHALKLYGGTPGCTIEVLSLEPQAAS